MKRNYFLQVNDNGGAVLQCLDSDPTVPEDWVLKKVINSAEVSLEDALDMISRDHVEAQEEKRIEKAIPRMEILPPVLDAPAGMR